MSSQTAVNTMPDLAFISQHLYTAVLWVSNDLSIIWLNAQTEQLLAISRERLIGQSILMLLAPNELGDAFHQHTDITTSQSSNHGLNSPLKADCNKSMHRSGSLTARFAQAAKYQQPFIDHDHKVRPLASNTTVVTIDYSVTPVVYQQHSFFIIEMWGKDRQSRITEEQRQQQQYNVARRMLRSVAHEVKNPLAGIRGAAQLLQRQFINTNDTSSLKNQSATTAAKPNNDNNIVTTHKKPHRYTDIIISETDRLTQLIEQLLGSPQLPDWQLINIHKPLEHVLTLVMNHYPQVTVKRDYDLSLPELEADADQLIQVFLNLINNACESMAEYQQQQARQNKHLPESYAQMNTHYTPKLDIQTRVAFQHTIGSQQHKQVLQVTITDNGAGIDPALIEQIFFPMVTNRAAGTGLGLSVVQDIINRHHGMIDVSTTQSASDTYDCQTCFTLYLPFAQPALKTQTE
ncbi:two-component sensor histidine kinase [Psychrobacter sp. F1192]|uniref:Sensory histidine kinase/phosphatase NtrB n=1 Tax=Psychrobacter coccoides TaxID=2818440 RepID=A0ABS3NKI4_9GAMM|nr:ATP-binding protein [Psychrobacter coccoides]MBO1529910.1 two-component sensor histidine kinase [Psychrobacter coccoides]